MDIKKDQVWQSRIHDDVKLLIVSVNKNTNTVRAITQTKDVHYENKIVDYFFDTFTVYYKPDEDDTVVTRVIFKLEKGSKEDVVAFLLDCTANYGNVVCYAHIGQHGEADTLYMRDCKPASPAQYKDLYEELVGRGYFLKIRSRLPNGFVTGGE